MPDPMMPRPRIATDGFAITLFIQGDDVNNIGFGILSANGIPQRPPKTFSSDLHHVSILQTHRSLKLRQSVPKKMHVNVSWPAVRLKLKMMMLDILHAVTHF